jgi:cell division protein FtsI (penicillin-binding protein 3)
VTLTINRDLQEICERALARATDSLDATGGDIVVMNPATGEILAMASLRGGARSMVNTAVTEPFEPGSTLKPFVAAALLDRGLARSDEMIPAHGGVLKLASRTITDLRRSDSLSLADVIRYSSNIGIVGFGSRLTPRQTFEVLRDLGFGTATGVPIPGESDGTLREPARWYAPSAASLAMGYEISVTPLQLVAAYSALANGGLLMQPHIVREIRDAGGELVYRAEPRTLRRVFSQRVASEVRRLLTSVVDSGTAVKADLARFQMAGKSGTARRTSDGRYVEGNYTASFVGLFPAERPQYVVLVKLDSPKGAFYGGEIAAPVSAVVLRAALAARDAALDRGELAAEERDVPVKAMASAADTAASPDTVSRPAITVPNPAAGAGEPTLRPTAVFALPFASRQSRDTPPARPVPEVAGLPLRAAVRALHQSGFRVILAAAQSDPTVPAAGTLLPHGSAVKLRRGP